MHPTLYSLKSFNMKFLKTHKTIMCKAHKGELSMKGKILLLGFMFAITLFMITSPVVVYAQEGETAVTGDKFMAMAISTGISTIAASYAVAKTGVAALATITEKPELFGRTILYVGLAEGIAIYGVLVAFLIWIS